MNRSDATRRGWFGVAVLALTFAVGGGWWVIDDGGSGPSPTGDQAVTTIVDRGPYESPAAVAATGTAEMAAVGQYVAQREEAEWYAGVAEAEWYAGVQAELDRRQAAEAAARARQVSSSSAANYAADGSGGVAARVRQCESGGNYAINTGNGYFGAYQFTPGTWNNTVSSMGRGDLANGRADLASPADQDAAFDYLYGGGSGAGHWPNC